MSDEITALPARSVVLSLLLGAHPDALRPAVFARAAERFGLSGVSVRVALTRAVAAGEVERCSEGYRPTRSLLARHSELTVTERLERWDGSWELVSVVAGGRPSGQRSHLRTVLRQAGLAELREGFWLRPANLRRPIPARPELECFRGRPEGDPRELVARLWDLEEWQRRGVGLLCRMGAERSPMPQLAIAAALARFLTTDPLLPAPLLPEDWNGERLRAGYENYTRRLRAELRVRAGR